MNRRVLILTPLLLACGPFFYQAPPPLESYPQRIPGKGWRELFAEAKPAAPDAWSTQAMIGECRELVGEMAALEPAERLARIDSLLQRNREDEFHAGVASFLHELRELAGDSPALAAAGPYLAWRSSQPGLLPKTAGSPPSRQWDWTEERHQQMLLEHEAAVKDSNEWLQGALENAAPEILPYLLVRQAELLRLNGQPENALTGYKDVIARYPGHPRAEVAGFMKGRCRIDIARKERRLLPAPGPHDERIGGLFVQARDEFLDYLRLHPAGRFVPDAHGWLGGIASDQGDIPEAISCHLKRLELQPSRETMRSVLRECDGLIATLFDSPEAGGDPEAITWSIPWGEIARHPEIARLFVFQALDPAARQPLPGLDRNLAGDRSAINYLHRRIVRPEPLVKLSLQRLGEAVVAATGAAPPDRFTLGVLGWSSLRSGDDAQALVLFDRALVDGKSDELLHGRARALSNLDRYREASAVYQEITRGFPASPLVRSGVFEAAIARFHAGEAGESLLMLLALRGENDWLPVAPLHPEYEAAQWIDTIAQFAPLDQLAAPLAGLPAGDPRAALLRAIVRTRALCAEDFELARRHLDPPEAAAPGGYGFMELPRGIGLTEGLWQQEVEPLASATGLLDEGPPDGKARRHLHLGRRWKAMRGRLTLPLHQLFDYSRSETEKLEQLRRRNAALLGIAPDRVTAELDSRDELHHALRHFLAAAGSSDPDIAAPALEEANEALFRLAEFSHYRCSRAVETDASGLSRTLVERLQRDFPDRPETARAAVWTFSPPALLGTWMPGDYSPGNSAAAIAAAILDPKAKRWEPNHGDAEGERLRQAFAAIPGEPNPELDMNGIRKRLAEFRADFERSRHQLDEHDILAVVDDLDDLASAAECPGIQPALFREYASIRRSRTAPPPAAGEWLPLAPWLAFLDRIRIVRLPDGTERANNDTAESWERYLREFPDGPKSEASSLRLLRIKVRAVCPIPQVQAFHFPDAPIPNGYKRLSRGTDREIPEMAELMKSLDAHEARFPGGRYRDDLLLLRAALATQAREYPLALKCLAEVLADPAHPELRMNAGLHFSELSLRLLDPHERPAVAAAFRAERPALPFLKNLVHGDTCLFRLRPLIPWLES